VREDDCNNDPGSQEALPNTNTNTIPGDNSVRTPKHSITLHSPTATAESQMCDSPNLSIFKVEEKYLRKSIITEAIHNIGTVLKHCDNLTTTSSQLRFG